jgi:transcriptional regulator with GAF, ATPase, and Fis domain
MFRVEQVAETQATVLLLGETGKAKSSSQVRFIAAARGGTTDSSR